MPSEDEILKALTLISKKYMAVAISWHAIVFLFLLFYVSAKPKIPRLLVTLAPSLLLLSVSFFAWTAGNPFNGVLFLAAGVLLFLLGNKRNEFATFEEAKPWSQIAGTLIFLSGFFYPHFLEGSRWRYLY